ncbi:MAG: GNAT family N-acetyltransferase [Pseudanabaena sp.]|nr:GNAT family N-acetyltransferase [Pseudanabaena sp. M53BS1SP1A06MG]MCA6580806.1 GNAT family N-acetyltransferase [Pseudanabaena sp. M34BS1SP1A06MG]MCA6592439.1 GNAT family N-acetyltransferase [Pseudanabaena sp. M38BS1SP1A06MG]MCA6597840.1 GNAT family N-acetyltransferase [Pseudanabaena sp. M046S1SP1A06QC]MCA6602864.1 GNAT family N-acetyltransferase [Pseudanabaena sp. M57BS1SP1A06MG]
MGISLDNLRSPEKLNLSHQIKGFDSGNSQLDDWLKNRAIKNEIEGASRTYVLCNGDVVIGFYCLANGSVFQSVATGKVRRNMPDPIPVMVIGRLAIDRSWQGKGLGRALLKDAILRTLQASEIAGIRAILVHAISENAKLFYEKCGFTVSPIDEMTLMIRIKDAITVFQ